MVMVSIRKVAEELGVGVRHAQRLVQRRARALEITPHYGRRRALSLSREDADRLIADYHPTRVSPAAHAGMPAGVGYFYLIQTHPDELANRVKLGYTDNLQTRLADHRTNAPTLKLLKSWPCKRTWEDAAKDSITRDESRPIGGSRSEVFDGPVQGFLQRAEAFFALMPHQPGLPDAANTGASS